MICLAPEMFPDQHRVPVLVWRCPHSPGAGHAPSSMKEGVPPSPFPPGEVRQVVTMKPGCSPTGKTLGLGTQALHPAALDRMSRSRPRHPPLPSLSTEPKDPASLP